MQDQFPEASHGLELSPQSLVVTHNFGSRSSNPPSSDRNLEISPQHPGTRLSSYPQVSDHRPTPENPEALGNPPMSAGSLLSDNPQIRNRQQMPNYPPMPECRQTNNHTPTDSYYSTQDYSTYNNPPAQGYPPAQGGLYEHHPSIDSRAYRSALPYSSGDMADKGTDLNAPQPNTEPSNPPIFQYPLPNHQGIDTGHISPVQTQLNCPAGPHVCLAGNTDHGEPDDDIQSPNTRLSVTPFMAHTIPPPYQSAGLPLPPTAVPLMDNPEREIIIAVMGVTGTGKSYFVREVSGTPNVEVSSSLYSCTTKVQAYSFPYTNVKITLVDTPGFNDTTKSDTQVLLDISTWMSSNYKEGKLLSGIIYLHRITDVRIDGTSLKNFKMFQRMCGPDALQNVLLTTTQWSNVNPALGGQREGSLLHEDFWGELISHGASLERFMGTRESGLGLIHKLIEKKPKPLCIQEEMAKGMSLAETDAGKFLNDESISLQKKYEKDLENLERDRHNAIAEKDNEMEMILAQEQSNAREKLEEAAAEMKLLADLHEAQIRKFKKASRKRNEEREKEEKAVIAVALDDISIAAHIVSFFTPSSSKGRLIYNIDDQREFRKDHIDITISCQRNSSLISNVFTRTRPESSSEGVVDTNYRIAHNKKYYWPKPGGPIIRGAQKFYIFTKYSH